jgi:uridylate kinase
MKHKYTRILLKLSGESLQKSNGYCISADILNSYAIQIKEIIDLGIQVGIVIGGGNIFRGLHGIGSGFDRIKGDQMGMLATIINSLALQNAIIQNGSQAQVFTSIKIESIGERFCADKALEYMSSGCAVIIAGGTGNPFFSTDTAAALRAVELQAQVLLKGTRVDGVYTADPEKDHTAIKYDILTFDQAIAKELQVMDMTAFALCKENHLPVIVFDMNKQGNLYKLLTTGNVGTLIERA